MRTFPFILAIVLVPSSVLVLAAVGANKLLEANCKMSWEESDFESRYSFTAGCQIKVKGRWIPAENYRDID